MIVDFINAIFSYFKVLPFLKDRKILWSLAVPVILSLSWGYGLFYIEHLFLRGFISRMVIDYHLAVSGVLRKIIFSFLVPVLSGLLTLFTFRYTFNIILSPWLSHFSYLLEKQLIGRGDRDSSNYRELSAWASIWRSIRLNVRNIWYEIGFTLLFFVISLVPIISPLGLLGLMVVQVYYAGFANIDFALEREIGFQQSLVYIRKRPGAIMGNGIGFILLFSIPVFGWMLAPIWSVAAGTYTYVRTKENQPLPSM